jgi:plasmid rolling circle replication initiator protein Rep
MNQAWTRLSQRKQFPAIGFVKSTEITRGADSTAHPHFHCLLMVESSYFKGTNYLSQEKWTNLWKESLRIDYTPVVNVKAVKENSKKITESDAALKPKVGGIEGAICETFKYSVKPDDLISSDPDWLVELTSQLHKTRSIALGGLFKEYLSEEEPEDLIGESDENEPTVYDVVFGWREWVNRYAKVDN